MDLPQKEKTIRWITQLDSINWRLDSMLSSTTECVYSRQQDSKLTAFTLRRKQYAKLDAECWTNRMFPFFERIGGLPRLPTRSS